jgi:hypothetical protein
MLRFFKIASSDWTSASVSPHQVTLPQQYAPNAVGFWYPVKTAGVAATSRDGRKFFVRAWKDKTHEEYAKAQSEVGDSSCAVTFGRIALGKYQWPLFAHASDEHGIRVYLGDTDTQQRVFAMPREQLIRSTRPDQVRFYFQQIIDSACRRTVCAQCIQWWLTSISRRHMSS